MWPRKIIAEKISKESCPPPDKQNASKSRVHNYLEENCKRKREKYLDHQSKLSFFFSLCKVASFFGIYIIVAQI